MTDYRLYFLDNDGRIERAVVLDFPTDGDAVAAAHKAAGASPAELWQRSRLVSRLGHDGSKIPAAGQ